MQFLHKDGRDFHSASASGQGRDNNLGPGNQSNWCGGGGGGVRVGVGGSPWLD